MTKCMACGTRVGGVNDSGRRERGNPGFVSFECGSWFQAPSTGVMDSGGKVEVSIDFGGEPRRRRLLSADIQSGRLVRLQSSLLHAEGLLELREADLLPSYGLADVMDCQSDIVRASSDPGKWNSSRLAWRRAESVKPTLDVDSEHISESRLPLGCYAASCRLGDGGLAILLGAQD
eukprot:CAMPEP_0177258326 /NCGR_PEP_ID=MMETSP0367-20130122/58045_1 /TAXON_ID=447022 ORGANISM="Scrippsiella hangoei-like, Strain SHHI-4" /NCGR_SAMPLE_ID=MMETSP0367 /ASSEMBLY_ACC=CAM_ASM_000362 /LENGTH=175 /DNA_ID=CAMNT_0018712529 /DNA_START=24 /DNA_END=548 /DNA_ORIENTATION=-